MLPHDDRGAGSAVLLLHAGVGDRTMWREHVEAIADSGFRVIAVDLPGFGEAPVGAGAQAPWNDVLETLQELKVGRASIVGNSFGAAVALRVAVLAPAAVGSLMLVSPPPLGLDPSPVLQAAWAAEESALARGDIDAAVTAVVDAWLIPEAPQALRDRVAGMQRRAFELQMTAVDGGEGPDPLEQHPDALAHLAVPVLAAAGTADMPDFIAGAQDIAHRVPHGRLVMIDGAGHLAPLETPDQFGRLMLGFLLEVSKPSHSPLSD